MPHRTSRLASRAHIWLITGAVTAVGGCNNSRDTAPEPAAAPAPSPAPVETEDEAAARRKAERQRKAQEVKEREEAEQAQLRSLIALPKSYPKKLGKACAQMLASYDAFMRKVLTGDMLTKWETGGNEMQLALFRKECNKRNAEVAACQSHVLQQLPVELQKHLPTVMLMCATQFGGDKAPKPPA